MNKLEKAIQLAKKWHKGQKDKAGVDYIKHPQTVAKTVKSNKEKIVAWLHDILEDTKIPLKELKLHFSVDVIEAIQVLTKRSGQSHERYLKMIKSNELARTVKLADLKHNSDLSRLSSVGWKDIIRNQKYQEDIKFLS